MKIYMMGDVSRISGILGGGNSLPPWQRFPELQKDALRIKMTREINLAARVARLAGATEILVHEACPMDMLSLDEELKLIRGGGQLYLDKTFAGIAFIGQGLAGRVKASNGMEKNIRKIELNGREADEKTICALHAGAMGVPVLCAGGAPGCLEIIRRFIPGLITDRDSSRAMKRGLASMDRAKPVTLRGAVTLKFTFGSEVLATMHTRLPNVVKTGKTTTAVRAGNMREVFAAYRASGLVYSVDWLADARIHKACRE